MRPQSQEEFIESLEDLIEHQEDIIEQMRVILVQQGDDPAILCQARVALSDWFIATYPEMYPGHGRPQLRVIQGGGGVTVVTLPRRYAGDRVCPECARLVSVEVAVDSPGVIGYRCTRGHKWLAGAGQARRPAAR